MGDLVGMPAEVAWIVAEEAVEVAVEVTVGGSEVALAGGASALG